MSNWDAEKFLDKVADYTAVARYLDNEMQEGKDEVTALANLAEKMGMDFGSAEIREAILKTEKLSDEELAQVAAAGNPAQEPGKPTANLLPGDYECTIIWHRGPAPKHC